MKKRYIIGCAAVVLVAIPLLASTLPPFQEKGAKFQLWNLAPANSTVESNPNQAGTGPQDCTTIQDGTLEYSDGSGVIPLGVDEWGYNYQGKVFNGGYCDAYRDAAWCQEYKDISLIMKWNDAWMSNKDCDGDGLLDRHLGFDTYVGSGAWETNTMTGEYDLDGKKCHWSSFTKIIAVPNGAVLDGDMWVYEGKELGQVIWGQFAIIFDKYSDSCDEIKGPGNAILYKSELPIGFGLWK